MTFLVLVIAVAVAQALGPMPSVQRDGWFYRWWHWLERQPWLQSSASVRWVIALLGPALAVGLVLGLTADWLFGLVAIVINFVVLLYTFGRADVNALARTYRDDLEREDVQAAWHDAAGFDSRHGESPAETWSQLHDQTLALVSYRYFERYFPIMFWFMVLGAPGALLYRLASLAFESRRSDSAQSDADSHLLWVLEWIPVRLLGLAFALVGNFAATIHHWREIFFCSSSTTADNLQRLIRGALDVGLQPSPHQGAMEMDALLSLYNRALILFLAVIAVATLLS